ncbi:uncharacterized protein APUU_30101S [Aspergillus puulaauensis]|uniref:Ketoreductase domain-containing protein n=1 Tax=Aspergillus puulaauensis TaxID=1220207 RepID=A0A7R7XI85_9EURO|nr:uncharacterized protein APUU_30101S [Aspergillus puulaauensis]BCS21876.1 hypothetical protein APUU_30101S [Aspergillus puulaauensis]
MTSDLSGRTTVITGAVGGLGFALTLAILQAGGDVVCLDLPLEPPREAWVAITTWATKSNTVATYHHCDVTNEEEIKAVLEKSQQSAQERNHPIRGLIAGAGIQKMYDAMEFPVDAFRKIHDINVTGSFLIAKHVARIMRDTGLGGSILLVASIAGYVASRGVHGAAYCASKAATHALCRSLATEWGTLGIRINSLSPGPIKTDLLDAMLEETPSLNASFMASNVLGPLGAPDDLQAAAIFFLGDGSSYVTGTDLLIDGGACSST